MISVQRISDPTCHHQGRQVNNTNLEVPKMPSKVNKILGYLTGKRSPERRASLDLEKKLATWMKTYNKAIKILLLGAGESGKTTIIKQMKILHFQGFTESERMEKAREIRLNVLECIVLITKAMSQIGIPLGDETNAASFQYIQNLEPDEDFVFTPEFFSHVQRLWDDPGIRACYDRGPSYQLPDCTKYFLDRVPQVRSLNYVPTDEDILHSRKTTTDIQKIEFQMPVPKKYGGGFQNFWMFDVGGQRGERRKWIQVFDGIHMILFLVACNVYDQFTPDNPGLNRLQESIDLFKDVWSSRFLQDSGFIIFLNKQDLLKAKVESGVSVATYFPSYHGYSSKEVEENDEYLRTRAFIRDLFWYAKESIQTVPHRRMSLTPSIGFSPIPTESNGGSLRPKRDCYWHYTTATDTNNIQRVFDDVHHMIIHQNLEMLGLT